MDDDSKQAWMQVGLHFAAAGDKLQTHAKAATERGQGGGRRGPGRGHRRAQHARQGDEPGGQLGEQRGARTRRSATASPQALNSMGDALNVTFADAGDKVGDKVAGRRRPRSATR